MPDIITTGRLYCVKNVYAVSSRPNTNNAGLSIAVGRHTDGYQAYGFFAFADGGIPANAKIVSAELGGVVQSRLRAGQYALTVRPCTRAWAEETLTYATMPVGSGAAATVVMGDAGAAFSADITAVVQAWFGGGFEYANGLYITSGETGSYKRVYPRSDSAGRGAYIDVTYYIPASQPTADRSSAEIAAGTVINIATNRLSAEYTHRLTWRMGATSGVIASGVADAATWVFSQSEVSAMLAALPSAVAGTCSIVCATYDAAGNEIGTAETAVALSVPQAVAPGISAVTLTGVGLTGGYYVQGVSAVRVETSAHPGAGSSIAEIRTEIEGTAYAGASITSARLMNAGTCAVTVTVTDARGRTSAVTRTVEVQAYAAPQIQTFSVERSNAAGTAAAVDGEYLRFTLAASAAAVGGVNHLTARIYTKKRAEDVWTLSGEYAAGASAAWTNAVLPGTFSPLASYDVRLIVTDTVGTESAIQTAVATQKVLLNFDPKNLRIKAGAVAEENDPAGAFIFALDAYFRKKLYLSDGAEISEALGGIRDEISAAAGRMLTAAKGQSARVDSLNAVHRQTIGDISSPFAPYRESDTPEITRIGKAVQLTGALTTSADVPVTDSAEQLMFTVPEGYRPERVIRQLCQGSQRSIWMLTVNPDGAAMFSRYRSGDAYATAAAGTWLPFHSTWLAALEVFSVWFNGQYCALAADSDRVTEGEAFTGSVVPNPGYALRSVKVLMGTADVTDVYATDGLIRIPVVTGTVYVEAVAVIVPEWMVDVTGTGGALEVIELVPGAVETSYDGAGTVIISKFGGAVATEENGNVRLA